MEDHSHKKNSSIKSKQMLSFLRSGNIRINKQPKIMNNEKEIIPIVLSNKRILKDLLEYLKSEYFNLPSHVFEVLGEVIDDLESVKI